MDDIFSRSLEPDPAPSPTSMERGFRILARQQPYEPLEQKIPKELTERSGRIEERTGSHFYLYILGDSARTIFQHIGWGHKTAENRVEQGGLLLGHVYRDSERRLVYGVVGETVPATGAYSSTTYLELAPSVWAGMLDRLDRRSADGLDELQVIGWYHTHPNDLEVFMSGTDHGTQERFFNRDWHFSLVLNPHKQTLKVFHGRQAEPCNIRIDERACLPSAFFAHRTMEESSDVATRIPPDEGAAAVRDFLRRAYPKTRGWRRLVNRLLHRLRVSPSMRGPGLRLEVVAEDRETGRVRIQLEGWLEREAVHRVLQEWLRE